MNRYWGPPEKSPRPELFTVRTSLGRLELHVCGLCGAITLANDDDQMQHARYHVVFDRHDDISA